MRQLFLESELTAKAPQLRQLTEPRRTATLIATVQRLEKVAVDDALDLLDLLMTTRLLARAERESARERLRTLPRFSRASAKLAAAIQVLLDAAEGGTDLSIAEVWAEIERVVPRSEVAAALAAVLELAPPIDVEEDEVWRAELVKRYPTVRPFLPMLTEVVEFGAVDAGRAILDAVRRLPELLRRKKVRASEAPTELVTGIWRRLVFKNADLEPGTIDHRAYAFCVLEQLHRALRRRDVFAERSERWADPRAQLLSGPAWEQARPDVLASLRLPERPDAHLTDLAGRLHAEYCAVAGRLPDNAAASPALVRSRMMSRSNSASAPKRWNTSLPPGVAVSMFSWRLQKPTPRRCSSATVSIRWRSDRPRRSSFQTTSVSPGRSWSRALVSSCRSSRAPLAGSTKTRKQLALLRASS